MFSCAKTYCVVLIRIAPPKYTSVDQLQQMPTKYVGAKVTKIICRIVILSGPKQSNKVIYHMTVKLFSEITHVIKII